MLAKLQPDMVKIPFHADKCCDFATLISDRNGSPADRPAWHEDIAEGSHDMGFTQAVRPVDGSGEHQMARFPRQRLDPVGICTAEADLDPGAADLAPAITPVISWSR